MVRSSLTQPQDRREGRGPLRVSYQPYLKIAPSICAHKLDSTFEGKNVKKSREKRESDKLQ